MELIAKTSLAGIAMPHKIGIFGGTFDPIHFGHLAMATEALEKLGLDEVRFIPCKIPVHKDTLAASAFDRAAMIGLAIEHQQKFILDTREIDRQSPSYTVYTLESLKHDFPDAQLFLFMGSDALAHFASWYQPDAILSLCHIIAFTRKQKVTRKQSVTKEPQVTSEQKELPANTEYFHSGFFSSKIVQNLDSLLKYESGHIYFIQNKLVDISSTAIRDCLKHSKDIQHLTPEKVVQYIREKKLYV